MSSPLPAFSDLNQFVELLQQRGQLAVIDEPVDPVLEISEICDRVVKRGGPALLFRQVKGHPFPVLINTFGSRERISWALRCHDLDDLAREIDQLLEPEIPKGFFAKLQLLPKIKRLMDTSSRLVSNGPCQEVIETASPSLKEIPILQCWPLDAGRYITLPVVVTRHPSRRSRNLGMYRLQVFDERTLGMHWQRHKGGAHHYRVAEGRRSRIEAAIALGPDPATIYSATAPLPDEVDELLLAGFLRRKPVDLVKCKTVDLEVPAESQFVLEGYVDPDERRIEGPFGDHTGFYSLPEEYPVFHLTAVTRRRHPIYPTIIVGIPPQEDGWLGKATERLFLPLIRKTLPEVVDMNLPVEGIFHNLAIVSIDKKYPGHAKKVMHALWGLGQLMFTKVVIVADRDCNVQDLREVAWRVGTHIDPRRDVLFSEGVMDVLEFASQAADYGSKMGIDATTKWPDEGFSREWPPVIRMSPEVKKRVDDLWPRLGL
ncbi:MAG: menaquinone biosynthesis decarboxylase [Armatimonadetes bacterium]|nr:menaquinone biosynthesis decarboxylase [Planctomycetota bacterium]MBI2200600.1 menaquinone biosynthesis decarboxylase [Armatimonadota bacterium]